MIAGSIVLWSPGARRCCAPSTGSTRCSRARRCSSLNNLVLVGLCFVVFWGTFFPLISEASPGNEAQRRAAVVRPLHGAAGPGAGAAVAGSGPLIAWRRVDRRERCGATFAAPAAGRRCSTLVGAARHGGVARSRCALAMFCLAAFMLAAVGQEFWRGDARAAGDQPASPRPSRWSRSCGATAGATAATWCTSGSRCCSSASRRRRRSSTCATCA